MEHNKYVQIQNNVVKMPQTRGIANIWALGFMNHVIQTDNQRGE